VLEEALTKAQKKNLQRRKKKLEAAGADGHSEAGTAATEDASSVDGWNDGAGSSNGGASSSQGTTAGAAALLSSNAFVTDIKRYQQLLGLYVGDDDSDDEEAELSNVGNDDSASDVSSTAAPVSLTRPGSSSSYSNDSTPPAPAPADVGSSTDAHDAALAAIMEQSRREYELQQEMQRQRKILSGYVDSAAASFVAAEEHAAQYEHAAVQAPPPVVLPSFSVPVVVPTAVPVAQPAPAHESFVRLGYQQQPTVPLWQQKMAVKSAGVNNAAGFGGYGMQQAAAFGVVPMAAGHGMAAAAGDDDDDLGDLLALCGVAG
jgi:hypothetical protein